MFISLLPSSQSGFSSKTPQIVILRGVCENSGESKLNQRWLDALNPHGVDIIQVDPVKTDISSLDEILAGVHGILLPGGDINIHPKYYGQEPIDQHEIWGAQLPEHCFCDAHYEAAESMVRYADLHKVPILGVCLGAQEMNVARGGTLQQRIYGHEGDHPGCDDRWDEVAHQIKVVKGGKLAKIFGGSGVYDQNSAHRQGMYERDLAEGLEVEALADDGKVVEFFSDPKHPFFVGSQGHVESSRDVPHNVEIFAAFVDAARSHAAIEPSVSREVGGSLAYDFV